MLNNYKTNEFNNSSIARSKRDVVTPFSEGKPMLIAAGAMLAMLMVLFSIQY